MPTPPDLGLAIDLSSDTLLRAFIWLTALIISLSVHEAAHAWMAYRRGDGTAYYQGRMTLDPMSHIDPIGTLLIPLFVFLTGLNFMFGWARPVPVNIYNLQNPSRDWMWVALAGPISNLMQLGIWLVVLFLYNQIFPGDFWNVFLLRETLIEAGMSITEIITTVLAFFLGVSILLNSILAFFNMIPIPPLDGSRVLNHFLPMEGKDLLYRIEPFGFLILLILLWTGVISGILGPVVRVTIQVMNFVAPFPFI